MVLIVKVYFVDTTFTNCFNNSSSGHPLIVLRVKKHDANNRDIDEMMREQLYWTYQV